MPALQTTGDSKSRPSIRPAVKRSLRAKSHTTTEGFQNMDDNFECRVRNRAYELWLENGRPNDSFWEQAETELKTAQTKNQTGVDAAPEENPGIFPV